MRVDRSKDVVVENIYTTPVWCIVAFRRMELHWENEGARRFGGSGVYRAQVVHSFLVFSKASPFLPRGRTTEEVGDLRRGKEVEIFRVCGFHSSTDAHARPAHIASYIFWRLFLFLHCVEMSSPESPFSLTFLDFWCPSGKYLWVFICAIDLRSDWTQIMNPIQSLYHDVVFNAGGRDFRRFFGWAGSQSVS